VNIKQSLQVLPVALFLTVPSSFAQTSPGHEWRRAVAEHLPLYGHRNWIVVADSAYPLRRCRESTILADAERESRWQILRGSPVRWEKSEGATRPAVMRWTRRDFAKVWTLVRLESAGSFVQAKCLAELFSGECNLREIKMGGRFLRR
jgi:hypothetical protein